MKLGRQNTLWFKEVDIDSLEHYEIKVFQKGVEVGANQIVPKDDALDGYDEVAGEMELRLNTIIALGDDAQGIYDFHIYSKNSNGLSEVPLVLSGADIDFLLPMAPTSGGFR